MECWPKSILWLVLPTLNLPFVAHSDLCKFHEGREELGLGTLALQCKKLVILRFCCILTRWPWAHSSPCFLHLLHVDNNNTTSEHSLNDKTLIRMYGKGNSNPLPVSLPRKSHGQRTEAGYSPWGHRRVRHNLGTRQQKITTIVMLSISHVPVGHWQVFVGKMSILFLCLFWNWTVHFFFIELCQFFNLFWDANPLSDTDFPHSLKAELSYETFWKPKWSKVK